MNNDERIHKLIDSYFEGELTAGEERELRALLLRHPGGDPAIDEALAVMGFAVTAAPKRAPTLPTAAKRAAPRRISVAAVATALLSLGVSWLAMQTTGRFSGEGRGECVAYVHGVRVDNEAEVMRLVSEQLGEMGMASEEFSREMADDFGDISEIFNSESI